MISQLTFFSPSSRSDDGRRTYLPLISAVENAKGVLDVDTVKGCTLGMKVRPRGGCYGECYANKDASRYGIDFTVSVSRKLTSWNWREVFCTVRDHPAKWYRIGVAGDPCHDWENTLEVCERLAPTGKVPVIITKHWIALRDEHVSRLGAVVAVVNTSVSGLDTPQETKHRVRQIERLRAAGVRSVARVITCEFGDSAWALEAKARQDFLLSLAPVIDNPLRASGTNPRVLSGDIRIKRCDASVGGGKFVSLHSPSVYLGTCGKCPDQCGVKVEN